MIIGIIALSDTMYGFQESQANDQNAVIDHPDHEEIEAELILQMTPLAMLLPTPPYWHGCGCTRKGPM